MIDLEFFLEHDEEEILNELYVGETQFVKDLIAEVSRARKPYMDTLKRPIKGNKDFIRIGDMISEEFGFQSCTFMVPYDTSMNAYTYPITMSLDKSATYIKPKFNKGRGLKFYHPGLSIIVAVTAGVWFSSEFSDREVVAAMLHEIGHSFVMQSNRFADIIEIRRLTSAILMFYKFFIDLYSLDPDKISNDIESITYSTNIGKSLVNYINKECANNPLFFAYNAVDYSYEFIIGLLRNIIKEINAFINPFNILKAIPTVLVERILTLILKPFTSASRAQEYLSDSFASMYGLGPELATFLGKIEYSPMARGSYSEAILQSTPIIGAIRQSVYIPILMIMHGGEVHPSTPARMNKVIQELNYELKNSDLNPRTKEELKKDIRDLEIIKDEFLDTGKATNYNAEAVKRTWMAFIANDGEVNDSMEAYYTDLAARNKRVKGD